MTATAVAQIQYVGEAGSSQDCLDAVVRFVQFGDRITRTRILTAGNSHALLMSIDVAQLVAVKSGFTSGYAGEGPRCFSIILELLAAHSSEIEEYDVDDGVIRRLDESALRDADLRALEKAQPHRPTRWYDYVQKRHHEQSTNGTLWQDFPPVIPLCIIDPRLIHLAIRFWDAPDEALFTAFRRLEDSLRRRTGIDQHGARLFSDTFHGPTAKLRWPGIDAGEQAGRANLFVGTYSAFRNPRAHHELAHDRQMQLTELLAVNLLFRLESEAEEAPAAS